MKLCTASWRFAVDDCERQNVHSDFHLALTTQIWMCYNMNHIHNFMWNCERSINESMALSHMELKYPGTRSSKLAQYSIQMKFNVVSSVSNMFPTTRLSWCWKHLTLTCMNMVCSRRILAASMLRTVSFTFQHDSTKWITIESGEWIV